MHTAEVAERRASEFRTSLAAFIVLVVACSSLNLVLDGVGWWFELAVVCLVVVGSAALTRALTRRRFAPPVVSLVVLLVFIVTRFAADTTILGLFPGSATFARFAELAEAAGESIRTQAIPATADTGILMLLVAGVGIIAYFVDLTVSTLRKPVLAGIPLLVLLAVPAMTNVDLSDGFIFALTAAGYLWLVSAGRWRARLRLTLSIGAVAIVGALVLAVALPTGVIGGGGGGRSPLVKTGLDPTLELGYDLRSTTSTAALDYATTAKDPPYLRLVTLEKFSGKAWVPDAPREVRSNEVTSFAPPPGLSKEVARSVVRSTISVNNFVSPWLPVPYPPSKITGLSGNWYWETGSLAVSSPGSSVDGQKYMVESIGIRPTPQQLSAAGTTVPAGFDDYLALPGNLPAIISDSARSITGGALSNYTKALAIQQYLRGPEFTYSEQAPVDDGYDGTGMAVIAKFLQAKSGYCIHFASTMAVMARVLGIPSRVAVGFQPGTAKGKDSEGRTVRTVTSHDFHAWPELYFEGIGWVPFEPTPGRGVVPRYADVADADVPLPIPRPQATNGAATSSPAPSAGRGRTLPGDAGGQQQGASFVLSGWLWVGLALLALVVLLLVPAMMRVAARRRRVNSATATDAWLELLATAEDVGHRLPDSLTPREVAAALAVVAGGHSLDRLQSAVEQENYAQHGSAVVDRADVQEVSARLRASIPWRRQLIARAAPVSVWRRLFGQAM